MKDIKMGNLLMYAEDFKWIIISASDYMQRARLDRLNNYVYWEAWRLVVSAFYS